MLLPKAQDDSLSLVEFDRKRAIASLDAGEPLTLIGLEKIHQRVVNHLKS